MRVGFNLPNIGAMSGTESAALQNAGKTGKARRANCPAGLFFNLF
jgi:hypothetical protein